MNRYSRLVLGFVVVVAVAVSAVSPPVSAETLTPSAGPAAAGWLARQLVAGERFEAVFDGTAYPDQGLTADAVLAFDAAHVAADAAAKATAWLTRTDILSGYLGDGSTEAYAGAHAKMLLVAEAQGIDPASFGGVDLLARLASLLSPSGQYADRSAFGDFSNGIGQSLAVIGLSRLPDGAPSTAVGFLAASQCADGGFPLRFGQASCTSSVDVTGFATQAMLIAGRSADAVQALDYLKAVQTSSGGFIDGPAANSNSTGLAISALRAGGRISDLAAVSAGSSFLRNLQVGCAEALDRRGAIAYDATGFSADTAVRATAQAVLGLADVGLAGVTRQGAAADAPTLSCGLTSTASTVLSSPITTRSTTTRLVTTTSTTPAAGAPTTSSSGATTSTTPAGNSGATGSGAAGSGGPTTSTIATRQLVRTGSSSADLALMGLGLLALGLLALRTGAPAGTGQTATGSRRRPL